MAKRSRGVAVGRDEAHRPLSRTLCEGAWLSFCADVGLGGLADLSWFAPPNELESAVPRARREVGERALYRSVLDRRGSIRGGDRKLMQKRGMSFAEFLQAVLLACWRRVVQPMDGDGAAAGGSNGSAPRSGVTAKGAMLRAVKEVVGRGIVPHAARLDVFPFRRFLANASILQSAAHALQPAFIHVFEHCCDPNAYALNPPAPAPDGRVVSSVTGTSLDASTPGGIAQRARGSPPEASVGLADFARMVVASGLLEGAHGDPDQQRDGVELEPADVGGAFVASLSSHSASRLEYDAFVEAVLRLAATHGDHATDGEGAATAAAAARGAAAAASIAAPSPAMIPQPIAPIDESALLARLPALLARQLLAVLPGQGGSQSGDLALAAVENAAIARAQAGEPDPLWDSPARPTTKGKPGKPDPPRAALGVDDYSA